MREITLQEVLDAREARAERQRRLLAQWGQPLLSCTLNIAGPVKRSALGDFLFRETLRALEGALGDRLLHREALAAGLVLGDGLRCLPAGLEPVGDGSSCLVTLREGKYHQVKRMLAARGKPVLVLHRLSMGPLTLDESLKPGDWRLLTAGERDKLMRTEPSP